MMMNDVATQSVMKDVPGVSIAFEIEKKRKVKPSEKKEDLNVEMTA